MTTAISQTRSTPTSEVRTWLDRAIDLAERGLMPEALIRAAIRRLCALRLTEIAAGEASDRNAAMQQFVRDMDAGPIAPVPEAANQQHYELPPEFFSRVLGKHRKYSACMWDGDVQTLDEAEARSLQLTCDRAKITDGMDILELGCGWGSLSLWMAEQYPASRITAVSNSMPQRLFIERIAAERELRNLRVLTADMNAFDIESNRFDRVVSVEMFEHMRNWRRLFGRIAGWLRPQGLMFMHIFCHQTSPYAFETDGSANWMGRYFFTGGIMPSFDLPTRFMDQLRVRERIWIDGTHYARTAEAWLANLDARRAAIMPVLQQTYGNSEARRWFNRWRIFFVACAELFAYQNGTQWGVGHYVLTKSD